MAPDFEVHRHDETVHDHEHTLATTAAAARRGRRSILWPHTCTITTIRPLSTLTRRTTMRRESIRTRRISTTTRTLRAVRRVRPPMKDKNP